MYNLLKILGIILISVCHIGLSVYGQNGIFRHLHLVGRIGVLIFVFVSGYGIYNSLLRNPSYAEFLKRRVSKIILPYYIVLVVYTLCRIVFHDSFEFDAFIAHLFFAHNLINGRIEQYPVVHLWFIGMILQLYLLAPLMFKIINKPVVIKKYNLSWLISLIVICLAFTITLYNPKTGIFLYYRSFIYYIYMFMLGMFAKKYTNIKGNAFKSIGDFTFYVYLANVFYIFTPIRLENKLLLFCVYSIIIIIYAFIIKYLEILLRKFLQKIINKLKTVK